MNRHKKRTTFRRHAPKVVKSRASRNSNSNWRKALRKFLEDIGQSSLKDIS